MGSRKALLIGAENYGNGFNPLPAVQQDINLARSALEASGYEVELCPGDVLSNASLLDALMRDFCSAGGTEDVRILYFTGHGLLAENVDCIVPAGTTRRDATVSPIQRVSTDLSRTVAESRTGLVLFIIDACRDKEDIPKTKGSSGWGDSARIARPDEERFVRFFGCAANEVCQVLSPTAGEEPSSLFTKVLAETLLEGNCVSLDERLGARAIWRINSYTNCWRKSMRIWPRRTADRAVSIAMESCIVPIMIVNLAAARNGTDAIAFVVLKKIAGDDEPRSRCVSWGVGSTRAWLSC